MTTPTVAELPIPANAVDDAEPVAKPAPGMPYKETARQGSLALIDQAIVSGTSFCTTLLVGRYANEAEFGTYALGLTLLYLAMQIQQSLVILPLTVLGPRMDDSQRSGFAASALIQGGLLAAFCVLALLLSAAIVGLSPSSANGFTYLLATLALSVPFVLLREFARRFEFSRLRIAHALAVDAGLSVLQLAGLCWLSISGQLTAITAHAMLGITCGVVGVLWLWRSRQRFSLPKARLLSDVRRHIALGKWALAGGLVSLANHYSMHWILLVRLGLDATGALAACMTLVDLSNPFMLGASNFVGPRAAHAIHREGPRALRNVVGWSTVIVCSCIGVFALVVALKGSALLAMLFRPELSPDPSVVVLLALATLALSVGMPHGEGLAALELPRLNFLASSLGLVATLSTIAFTLDTWGLTGAAAAFLVGCTTSALFRTACFWWAVARCPQEKCS